MATSLPPHSPCAGCATRRAFLRDAVAAAGVALAGIPLASQSLGALAAHATSHRGAVRYPIPPTDGTSIDVEHEVILVRAAGFAYAFALSCPHQNTALKALPRNTGFQCARHKSRYRPTGEFISGRATRHMDRLAITRDGDQLVVDPDRAFESDTDAAGWGAARVAV
jgi:nitrite reductase/ring-hydroxylating ferredoxin subunit